MIEVPRELMWYGIAFAMTAGASFVTLLGLYLYLAVLRKRWLPLPRLRPGTWTGREVIFAFCVAFGFKDFIIALLLQIGFFTPLIGPPPDPEGPIAARTLYALQCNSISSPMTVTLILGILFAVMFARTGSRPHHYGLAWARWPANLGLGLAVFLLAWPVIMGSHALAVHVVKPFDPFIALGNPGSLGLLRDYGFDSYPQLFDETYDDVTDRRLRFERVYREVERLCALPEAELDRLDHESEEIVIRNAWRALVELPQLCHDRFDPDFVCEVLAPVGVPA